MIAGTRPSACPASASPLGDLDPTLAMLGAQGRETSVQLRGAEAAIRTSHDKLIQENQKQLKAVRQQIRAEREKGFWDRFLDGCRSAIKCVGAVVTAVTGGVLGIIGAALTVASMILAYVKPDRTGALISTGLGLAGGALGGLGGGGDVGQGTDKGCALASTTAEGAVSVPRSLAERRGLRAQATVMQSRALKERLRQDSDEQRELMQSVLEARRTSVEHVLRAMGARQQTLEGAIGKERP